jgi:Flp pilus assembly pilin Flp
MAEAALVDDERGASAVVGKVLATGIAVMYIAGMTTLLLGGVVPDYRTASGAEIGDRILATAAGEIEESVPAVEADVELWTERSLPETIRDRQYELVLSGHTLTLAHPDPGIGAKLNLSLPQTVTVRNGTWSSRDRLVVYVNGTTGDRTIAFQGGA